MGSSIPLWTFLGNEVPLPQVALDPVFQGDAIEIQQQRPPRALQRSDQSHNGCRRAGTLMNLFAGKMPESMVFAKEVPMRVSITAAGGLLLLLGLVLPLSAQRGG